MPDSFQVEVSGMSTSYPRKREALREPDNLDDSFRNDVIENQGWTCAGCGFISAPHPQEEGLRHGYMEVHPLNHDHRYGEVSDWSAFCPFCHQSLHLHWLALLRTEHQELIEDEFDLIGLPDYRPEELFDLVHSLFYVMSHEGTDLSSRAHRFYSELRSAEYGISSPADYVMDDFELFSEVLLARESGFTGLQDDVVQKLDVLRLLPRYESFQEELNFWVEHAESYSDGERILENFAA